MALPDRRRLGRIAAAFAAYGFVAALVFAPVAAEQALTRVHFDDRLGTLPVQVALAHNGVSTLDTGVLGRLYWERTGVGGFGASLRVTGPPEAGGSLASYLSPAFVKANVQFVNDPGEVARVYGRELRSRLLWSFGWIELVAWLVGGLVLTAVFRGRGPFPSGVARPKLVGLVAVVLLGGLAVTSLVAALLFRSWEGNTEIGTTYPMPGIDKLSFSSPEALEVARQVRPFIEKNTDRIQERAREYEQAADASLRAQLPEHAAALAPRDGERIVIAEADPQGSRVGTQVRTGMYALLRQSLGDDAFALRTISGDITSNGTVAEEGFTHAEAAASPEIPTAAVTGDHDTETTVEQLDGTDLVLPDLATEDAGDLRVAGADDPAFKALFGGLVVNDSGTSETELGARLRDEVDPEEPAIVLLHQPRAAAGYLGIESTDDLEPAVGRETVPWDDGIPDVPPGSVNIGHLHDVDGPWVVWNTDGDMVTWTVVSQLGTSGGVEENPTFNRFSTPFSVPLKTLSVQLQYVDTESGLQTGYAAIDLATDGTATISDRVDLGLPGGKPVPRESVVLGAAQ